MAKHKLQRFAENETFTNLFQHQNYDVRNDAFPLKGKWGQDYFHNDHPIVVEVGCGRGEYTVSMARNFPDKNFVGMDRKGARLWRGCKDATLENLTNAAFIRGQIDDIDRYFAPGEVSEIWVTFPDPQPKKPNKRLSSERFLGYYKQFLRPGSPIHLKTDSQELHDYTLHEVIPEGGYRVEYATADLYATPAAEHPDIPCLAEAQMTQTFYERMFLAEGKPITYIKWIME